MQSPLLQNVFNCFKTAYRFSCPCINHCIPQPVWICTPTRCGENQTLDILWLRTRRRRDTAAAEGGRLILSIFHRMDHANRLALGWWATGTLTPLRTTTIVMRFITANKTPCVSRLLSRTHVVRLTFPYGVHCHDTSSTAFLAFRKTFSFPF